MTRSKSNPKKRLTEAMIATAARYGYGKASVAKVVARAGVSRATFYEHFKDKEECFLAAYREVAQRIVGSLEQLEGGRGATVGAREILRQLLDNADREPAAALANLRWQAEASGRAPRRLAVTLSGAFLDHPRM